VKSVPSPPIYPSCTISVPYTPGFVDVYVGGSHVASDSVTATTGTTIILPSGLLWTTTLSSNSLGISTAGQTQVLSGMGNITAITLNGVITTAYTLSYYATNLVLVTFNAGVSAGNMIFASGNVYIGGAIEVVALNTAGPTWTTGVELPTATMPAGSLYSCSGDHNRPLWVTNGTIWLWVMVATADSGSGGAGGSG
jgi:hypothetical protein